MLHSVVAGAVGTATGMDGFPSGQRGQTVNLLQIASVVRIHLHPFEVCVADFNLCINEVNGTALVRMSMI